MLAVIETGGKQYHVKPGDVIKVDSLDGKLGDKVNFTNIVALYSNDKGNEIKIGVLQVTCTFQCLVPQASRLPVECQC